MLIATPIITLSACPGDRPKLDVTVWAANSEFHGIVSSHNEFLGCYNPKFQSDGFICISGDDIKKVNDYLDKCEKWK